MVMFGCEQRDLYTNSSVWRQTEKYLLVLGKIPFLQSKLVWFDDESHGKPAKIHYIRGSYGIAKLSKIVKGYLAIPRH